MSNINLNEHQIQLKECITKLKSLLDKPETGLMSWHMFYEERIEELRALIDKYQDTEADGVVFCGKCGKIK